MENESNERRKRIALPAENVCARYFYIGTHAGMYLENSMKSAKKSIKIVSPYLDDRLIAELLKEKALAHVDISIITSASKGSLKNERHKKALMSLFPKFDKEKYFCNCLCIKEEDYTSNSGDDFVHAKFYIIDDKLAYLGSLNFTQKGINDNYEFSMQIIEEEFVTELCKYFDGLFNKGFAKYSDKELFELLYPTKARN